jgi:hypothetical protein
MAVIFKGDANIEHFGSSEQIEFERYANRSLAAIGMTAR